MNIQTLAIDLQVVQSLAITAASNGHLKNSTRLNLETTNLTS